MWGCVGVCVGVWVCKILAGVLRGNSLAPYLFIIPSDYSLRNVIRSMVEDLALPLDRGKPEESDLKW